MVAFDHMIATVCAQETKRGKEFDGDELLGNRESVRGESHFNG